MITTKPLSEARGYIEQADRLVTETYPIASDPKLLIPALKLVHRSLGLIENERARDVLATISEVLEAYDERVVEFPRDGVLVFADDQMRTTTVSVQQVLATIDETKRAYSEAYE